MKIYRTIRYLPGFTTIKKGLGMRRLMQPYSRQYRSAKRWSRFLAAVVQAFKGWTLERIPQKILGTAFVTDGDGLEVKGHVIRMAGLDAPEHDQPAQRSNGQWFNHGRQVKSALIRKIGGRDVEVVTHGRDPYGRVLGTVFLDGEDINRWLVLRGLAIAAYGKQYQSAERWSRAKGLGMWGLMQAQDPREWRHRD
ncbi:MAG: thermonuclease family protein [Gammaproteobacteria bacterium]|nr:thermonuclease family protein [Gammaproteobacteria bacterium]